MSFESKSIVILVGPKGSGKSTHAKAIADKFGCNEIVDPWDGTSQLRPGTLAVSNIPLCRLATPFANDSPDESAGGVADAA